MTASIPPRLVVRRRPLTPAFPTLLGLLVLTPAAELRAQETRPRGTEPAPLVLVSGTGGGLPLDRLGLGDGGIRGPSDAPLADAAAAPADARTPAGIRLRARPEGVKIDFPSGAEVLVTPSLRVCLRSGEETLPALGTLVLAFADGSRLELEPDGGGRRPLRRVTLQAEGRRHTFWPAHQTLVVDAAHARTWASQASGYLVLGDGRAFYRAVPWGPLLGLRSVLRPGGDERFPASRVVVAGDALAASLRRLPAHVPPQPVQFPQAPEAACRLAELAGTLFAGEVERPAHARGPLVLALPQEWRLSFDRGVLPGTLTLGLGRAGGDVPAVEWTISRTRTELHLVRPFDGHNGGPRYFLRGIDLSADLAALWPCRASGDDLRWLEQELARLGVRPAPPADARAAR